MKLPRDLARVAVSVDERHLLPHAGLLPAAALAQRDEGADRDRVDPGRR
jgi:hypothetical protein